MSNFDAEPQVRRLKALLADLFAIDAHYRHGDEIVFSLRYHFDRAKSDKLLQNRLKLAGYLFQVDRGEEGLLLSITGRRRLYIPRLNIALFLLTLGSTLFVPVMYFNLDAPTVSEIISRTLADIASGRGLEFTAALMSILLVHEMGHFIASRRRGIITSWPYFIPAPNLIGTFGAMIKSMSPFQNRRDLIEVGASGPIAGWFVALGWLLYGLAESSTVTTSTFLGSGMIFTLEGESILIKWLVPIMIAPPNATGMYLFSEAAFAGWVGLLVTAINMLPIGQLDGGHVLYGLFGRRQVVMGWLAIGALAVLGFWSPSWWLFAGLGLVMGVKHPPTMDDRRLQGTPAKLMAWVALLIFALSFTPILFR